MILRELREIDHQTDDILVYGNDGTNNQKVKTDSAGHIDIINDNLDTPISTRSSESTLSEVRDTIGQESGSTVLSRLLDIWNKLVSLFNDGVAKVKIWDGTLVTDVVDDAGVKRLAVDSNVEGGVSLQRFLGEVTFDISGIALNISTDTSLISQSGNGQLDFICIAGSNSSYEVILKIDGVEKFRIDMDDLGSDLGLSNATNVPVWVETANKNFRFHPTVPMDFTTSFEILAKATGTPTPDVNWLVTWRLLAS